MINSNLSLKKKEKFISEVFFLLGGVKEVEDDDAAAFLFFSCHSTRNVNRLTDVAPRKKEKQETKFFLN